MLPKESKIIIVGSGVFGLSSALHLASSGYTNITIFDRLDLHSLQYTFENGADTASADINKVFRAHYAEREYYHKLALEAKVHFDGWDSNLKKLTPAEAKAKYNIDEPLKIIENTGLIRLDNTKELDASELENLKSFTHSGLRDTQYDINNPDDLQRAKNLGWFDKINAFGFRENPLVKDLSGVLDSTSGLIYANKALLYVYQLLKAKGVSFITGEEKGSLESLIESEGTVEGIITKDGASHKADLTILAAGPWTPSFVPELAGLIEAHTGNVILIKIPEDRTDLIEKYSKIPILNWRVGENKEQQKFSGIGVFPITDGYVKLITRQRKFDNPTKLQDGSVVSVPVTSRSTPSETRLSKSLISTAKDFIRSFLPDLVEFGIHKTRLLWYTDTINNDFLIDYVPGKKRLLVVTGGSGHGFKFLPVLGQFVVDRIEGNTNEYLDKFKWRNPQDYTDINRNGEVRLGTNSYYDQELSTVEDLKFSQDDLTKAIEID